MKLLPHIVNFTFAVQVLNFKCCFYTFGILYNPLITTLIKCLTKILETVTGKKENPVDHPLRPLGPVFRNAYRSPISPPTDVKSLLRPKQPSSNASLPFCISRKLLSFFQSICTVDPWPACVSMWVWMCVFSCVLLFAVTSMGAQRGRKLENVWSWRKDRADLCNHRATVSEWA